MESTVWLGNNVTAIRIKLCHSGTEMIVNGSTFEYALLYTFFLSVFIIPDLQDDG